MAAPLFLLLLLLAMFTGSDAAFCVCKTGVPDQAMQAAIDYACAKGADCASASKGRPATATATRWPSAPTSATATTRAAAPRAPPATSTASPRSPAPTPAPAPASSPPAPAAQAPAVAWALARVPAVAWAQGSRPPGAP
uniref:X8 domain-containing protein n=1 Tax=Zea mays TaxID=4577 RepID=C0PJ12_MAIZE|nr:unknown [Zea mays]